jgi:hypothetical protein
LVQPHWAIGHPEYRPSRDADSDERRIRFALATNAQNSSTAAMELLIEVTAALRSPEFGSPDIN